MTRVLQRYAAITRLNHWFVALMFICAGLSGLSFFHPALFFLTQLFGGGPWTRILHPFFGLLMVSGFALLLARVWRENLWTARDTEWLLATPRLVATADESGMPPAGKYNAGQKAAVWSFAVSLLMLLLSGFVFWQPWFADYFAIELRRIAVVVHAASAVLLILSVIIHVYAAIWVKGTLRAMTHGTVSASWARHNHPLWYRKMGSDDRLEK